MALVTEIAMEFRQTFKKDVVIDIICFRKLGHNEQDEPMVTQPLMYKKIAQHPGTRKLYADKLVAEGVLTEAGRRHDPRIPRPPRQGRFCTTRCSRATSTDDDRLVAVPDKKYIETLRYDGSDEGRSACPSG